MEDQNQTPPEPIYILEEGPGEPMPKGKVHEVKEKGEENNEIN